MASGIRRRDGKLGGLASILGDLFGAVEAEVPSMQEQAIHAVQEEVVARCPVKTGNLKSTFAAPDAISHEKDGRWWFGLLTPQARKRAYYWVYVEYGTKGGAAKKRGKLNPKTGRRTRVTRAATKPKPAHPFMRPGIQAARARFKEIAVDLTGKALDNWRKGK
jgi:HK97 gp10 family phage protein